ncbi:MAG: DUF1127 domain-containing protein [Paracoccaceae bacterium]
MTTLVFGRKFRFPALTAPSIFRISEVRRQRRTLARLTDAQLRDIGVSRADADAEASRPFWDLPAHR